MKTIKFTWHEYERLVYLIKALKKIEEEVIDGAYIKIRLGNDSLESFYRGDIIITIQEDK